MSKSYEVLHETFTLAGTKIVAEKLGISGSSLYKWGQPAGENNSGIVNPLDRILDLCKIANNEKPVDWLCQQLDSFRVKNSLVKGNLSDAMAENLQSMINEFSEVLNTTTKSYAQDNNITKAEASKIRQEWEELKTLGETFVFACENELFSKKKRS